MQGQWEEPIKVLAYRTPLGETLGAGKQRKKEQRRHNGWLLYTVSFPLVTRQHVCLNLAVFRTMAQWGSCSLKQSTGNVRELLQATQHNSPTKKTQDQWGTHSLPLRHQTTPESEAHTKTTRCKGKKWWRAKMLKVAYTHWMITTSRVQLQQRMYDARECRRGGKRAW